MALSDITRPAVLAAIKEYDKLGGPAFLEKHGFGTSRNYWLIHQGVHYESKAILGVAHTHVGGHVLNRANGFKRGGAPVQEQLEALGFTVTKTRS